MAVQLKAVIPPGCFAWGCGVLKDKPLCIGQVSALPLVPVAPCFVERFRAGGARSLSVCSPTGLGVSISGVMSS